MSYGRHPIGVCKCCPQPPVEHLWRCGFCGQTYESYNDSVVCIKLHQREESEAKCLGYLTLRETLEKAHGS